MHQEILHHIVSELSETLSGATLGKIWQVARTALVIDFRRRDTGYLFISTSPSRPQIHLIRRTTRELEKQSLTPGEFVQSLRAILTGSSLEQITQDEGDRVIRLKLLRQQETGALDEYVLVAQMTGRSANLFLLDGQGRIMHALRSTTTQGQQRGEFYEPPPTTGENLIAESPFTRGEFDSWSAAADHYYQQLESTRSFETAAAGLRNRLRQDTSRLQRLRDHLKGDLTAHGDPKAHKRLGDLLLANISGAERAGNKVVVTDFFVADMPLVEIEVDENVTLSAAAAEHFARYGKAKRAGEQIARRLEETDSRLMALQQLQAELEKIVAARDETAMATLSEQLKPTRKSPVGSKVKQAVEKIPGVRRYQSSDGYEILVGRAAKDNDNLTFRVARAQDLWLHAADYPGSHVIVRNPSRKDIPPRTLIEAAQLAARFSQAANDAKVSVHYTQQKFVSRIKGAAPGLVRLASFRTISVEPKEGVERI